MAKREWLGMRLGGMRTWLRGRDWGRPAVNEAGRDGIGLVERLGMTLEGNGNDSLVGGRARESHWEREHGNEAAWE